MAGRPKIQFANDEEGDRAWAMLEKIQTYRYESEVEDLEAELKELRLTYPNATITSNVRAESAGKTILSLLEAEIERIEAETRKLRDNRR